MKIAIHQPNYMPWLGYFYKISQVNQFVILDDVQFSKGSYTNRTNIKTPNGIVKLSVPIISNNKENINQILIHNKQNWQEKHWKTIESNYKKTQHFNEYKERFENIFFKKYERLFDLNLSLLKLILNILEIDTDIIIASELKQDFGQKNDRILNICKYLNADEYLSGNGAKNYNVQEDYDAANIKLQYTTFLHPTYKQKWGEFVPNLSTIDMIFNDVESGIIFFKK